MTNDQLAALLESFKAEILKKIDSLEAKVSLMVPVVNPPAPVGPPAVQDIWTGLKVDQPLAEYEVTEGGWINRKRWSQGFPGDREMLRDGFDGISTPTGIVYHGGNVVEMASRRRESFALHAADLAGTYGDTPWGKANTAPECAAVLICLGMARTNPGWMSSDAQFSPGAWANLTSLNDLFLKLKSISEGTGGPSGQP